MGGCSSKPKTAEYDGLMGPEAVPHDGLGRESLDTDPKNVDTALQSVDTGLKSIGSSHPAQKGSERSLQTLFVQHESGAEGLVDNNSKVLNDVLNSEDVKKQTVSGFSSETNLQQGEVRRGVEEGTITEKAEEGTGSVVKEAQEEATPAVVLTETCVDKPSTNQEAAKECAAAAETELQESNGDGVSAEARELPKESIVKLPSPESEASPQESAEPICEDKASEIAKPAVNGLVKDETFGSDPLETSQSEEADKVVDVIDASEGRKVETLNGDAPESSLCEDASPATDAMEGGQIVEKEPLKEEISQKTSIVEEKSDVATSKEVESSDITAVEHASPVEDAVVTDGQPAEATNFEPLDHVAATTESSLVSDLDKEPLPAIENQDQCSEVPPVVAAEESKSEASELVEVSRNEEATQIVTEPPVAAEEFKSPIIPEVESLSYDSATPEAGECIGKDELVKEAEAASQTDLVDDIPQPDLNENIIEDPSSQAENPSSILAEEVHPENADIKAEKGTEESSNTLAESECAPKEAPIEIDASDLPLQSETNIGEPQPVTFIDTEVAHSKAPEKLINPHQAEEKVGEIEAGANIEEMHLDKIQEGSNHCDQIPSTSVPVGEVSQGIQLEEKHFEEQDKASLQHEESQVVAAAVEKALLPETQSVEVAESVISTEHIPSAETSRKDLILEKLAPESERQTSEETVQ